MAQLTPQHYTMTDGRKEHRTLSRDWPNMGDRAGAGAGAGAGARAGAGAGAGAGGSDTDGDSAIDSENGIKCNKTINGSVLR